MTLAEFFLPYAFIFAGIWIFLLLPEIKIFLKPRISSGVLILGNRISENYVWVLLLLLLTVYIFGPLTCTAFSESDSDPEPFDWDEVKLWIDLYTLGCVSEHCGLFDPTFLKIIDVRALSFSDAINQINIEGEEDICGVLRDANLKDFSLKTFEEFKKTGLIVNYTNMVELRLYIVVVGLMFTQSRVVVMNRQLQKTKKAGFLFFTAGDLNQFLGKILNAADKNKNRMGLIGELEKGLTPEELEILFAHVQTAINISFNVSPI